MRSARYSRISLMLLLGLVLAEAQAPQLQEASLTTGSATISDFKGKVAIQAPHGSAVAAQRGQVVAAETTIETRNGSVLLALQDGSQVLVKPHSRVVLKSPQAGKGYYLELFFGNILAKIKKRLENSPSFRMGTPSAVITVRGTEFTVGVTKSNRTIVEVFEGLVAVAGFRAEDQPVLVRPGFWIDVYRDRLPEQPRQRIDLADRDRFERESRWSDDRSEYPSRLGHESTDSERSVSKPATRETEQENRTPSTPKKPD